MLRNPLRNRGRTTRLLGAATALATAAALVPMLVAPASADTPGNPVVTTASVDASAPSISPSTPLTGLVDGQTITIKVDAPSPPVGNAIYGVDARLCQDNANIVFSADFAPTQGGRCITTPLSAISDEFTSVATAPPNTTATLQFRVGTGTNSYTTSGGTPVSITCDATHPCDLWLRQQVPTSLLAAGVAFTHYDLSFAGAPDAPTGGVGTPGNGSATLNWTAPASTGNSPIDYYVVTPTSPAGPPVNTVGPVTSLNLSGLTNFTAYSYTVSAHNAAGFTSAPSAPITVTPTPAAPTAPTATPGDSSASITWTTPSGTVPTGYRITALTTGAVPAPAPIAVVGAPAPTVFPGLTNGQPYTFTVAANYGAGVFGAESPQSNIVTPNATFVTQTIQATRPAGTLDIAEACANGTGVVPAGVGPQFGSYPQGPCLVDLGTATLNAAATYYNATGAIQTVSVRDTRDTDVGWNVNAQLTPFTSATDTFGAGCLGLVPAATELSNDAPVYSQLVTPGVTTTSDCGAAGLGATTTVLTAATGGGLGRADLDGALNLNIPVSADAGTYQATLTFTVL